MTSELPQTLSPALSPGYLLKEYSLLGVLGMGAFGITYLAADNYLQLKVAIKEYFPSSAAVRNPFSGSVAMKSEKAKAEYLWGRERFMREAQTLARFRHKNIVQVFRYFEGNGTCYMVMAYEEGKSLEQALSDDETGWDERTTLAIVMPLLDGLESVHRAGFLHRDIKPANIVLRSNDSGPVLIDFGAARSAVSNDAMTIVLSHGYGPPEQYSRHGNQGPWTDIYAMAAVLYRITTRAVPPLSLHRLKNDAMIPAGFLGEGRFSTGFLEAIDLALNVDETRRPQSIGEWRQLLTRGMTNGAVVVAPEDDARRSGVRINAPLADRMPVQSTPDADTGPHRARPANGNPSLARSDASPSRGRGAVARTEDSRRSGRIDEDSPSGWLGRLGATMIAHPFLSLLLFLAAIAIVIYSSRRSGAPEHSNSPVIAPAATGSRTGASQAGPAVIPQERARPTSGVSAPPAAGAENPSRDEPERGATTNERRRGPPAEAFTACSDKLPGAVCAFLLRGNEHLTGACARLPDGSLVCKPERAGERGDRPRVMPPPRQQSYQDPYRNPTDNRPAR